MENKVIPNYFFVTLETSSQVGCALAIYPGGIYNTDGSRRKRLLTIHGIDDWNAWLAEVISSTHGVYTVMASSTLEFPEELTDDKALINLCHDIAGCVRVHTSRN